MLYDPKWTVPPAPVVTEPWRQVLLDAADYIEAHGWSQGCWSRNGMPCALWAIIKIGADHDLVAMAQMGMEKRIGGKVAKWNDAPGRTSTEVCATLREVARS